MSILVDGIRFDFPLDWRYAKYDDWRYYRNRFCNIPEGRKAVDLLVLSPQHELFLVEVKDYREHPRLKPSAIHEEVSHKVIDTLAALLPASLNDDFPDERDFATDALACTKIRIVLHLEQSRAGSRIAPRKFKLEDIQQKLRQSLRAVDRRAAVCDIGHLGALDWSCA